MVWSPAVWQVAEHTGVDAWEVAHWPASTGWAHLAYLMWKSRCEKAAYDEATKDTKGSKTQTKAPPVDALEAKHRARAERNRRGKEKRHKNGRATG
jgi:hypothetical protein